MDDLRSFAETRCEVVGVEWSVDGRKALDVKADFIVVLGGDGTLIGVARSLGVQQVPLIGVNIGKLGFLAEFTAKELKERFDQTISDATLVHKRLILRVEISERGRVRESALAINDCVVHAGPPFRLIQLGISINEQPLCELGGDGVIVCTPIGSTAHNLSAGGPIMEPSVDAIIVTPLCPHSLTHKPLVVDQAATIEIVPQRVNEGTTLMIDGQVSFPLQQGVSVRVRRFERDLLLVRNPMYADWHKLVTKLHWGRAPGID
ncbi:MAG: NAD(+)/NADH kinase [Planctomycetota bacterium]